jgi:hypothetical protein
MGEMINVASQRYNDLFQSFVSGGGLRQKEEFEDSLDYDDALEQYNGGGRKAAKAPKAKAAKAPKAKAAKAPKAPKAPKAAKAPKAKKVVNEDDVKIVEVDIFTVTQCDLGITGGTYKSRTPRSAALKAAGAIFKASGGNKTRANFIMQKITPRSNKRLYSYEATLQTFKNPQIVVKHDKDGNEINIPITRKISIKKTEVPEDIRREQKEALKAERKAIRDKEKAKAKKAEKAEMKAKGVKPEKKPKKNNAKKAAKEEKDLLKKADDLISKYSASLAQAKPKGKGKGKGKGKKNQSFWGGVCGNSSCY